MFNMFGNIFGRMFTPPAAKKEESVFEGAECVNCKAEAGYNPYCDGVRCYDKEDYLPEGYTEDELRSVYYDLNQEAGIDYLVESADFDEVDDYYNPGTEEVDPAFVLEAVTVKKFSRLEGVIRRGMLPVMKEHMKMKDPTTGEPINVLDPIVGKCKKSGGFAYVTAQIPFSDGQVVSIIFHAPEGDGKKIGPSDMVVAFRWLLNKRDITAVVAPEDGKEISLKTIALRLAQLVGKNAKRFAATQKEVQAEKRQLEELQEKQKELDEQAKTYEEQIAGAQEAKTSTAEEIGSLQAQLAKQLAANRELEVKLAGLKKLEEEGRKTEPEPTPEPKAEPEPKAQEGGEDGSSDGLEPVPASVEEFEKPPFKVDKNGFIDFKSDKPRSRGKENKTWFKVNADGTVTLHSGGEKITNEFYEEIHKVFDYYNSDGGYAKGEYTFRPAEHAKKLLYDITDGVYDKNLDRAKRLLPTIKEVLEKRRQEILSLPKEQQPGYMGDYWWAYDRAVQYIGTEDTKFPESFFPAGYKPNKDGNIFLDYTGPRDAAYAKINTNGTSSIRFGLYVNNIHEETSKDVLNFVNEYISRGYAPVWEGGWYTFYSEDRIKEMLQNILAGKYDIVPGKYYESESSRRTKLLGGIRSGMKFFKTTPGWIDLFNQADEYDDAKTAAEKEAITLQNQPQMTEPEPAPEPAPQVTEPEPVPAEPIEPEPAQDDKADKPEWVNDMQDIIDGKYDNDLKKMGKLLNLAIEELDKPGCDPKWEELANEAADRRTVLLKAKAKAAGF